MFLLKPTQVFLSATCLCAWNPVCPLQTLSPLTANTVTTAEQRDTINPLQRKTWNWACWCVAGEIQDKGEQSTCKCGTWAIFLSSWPFFLMTGKHSAEAHNLHMKLLTPSRCCWSVLLTQAQTGRLRHPLWRNWETSFLWVIMRRAGRLERCKGTGSGCDGHAVTRSGGSSSSFFPSLPALSASGWGKSAGKWRICSLTYQWQSCPCCQTHLSSLLPGEEQISRKKVTAVCTLCMWHLTQSTNTAWGKRHWQVQQHLQSLPWCQNLESWSETCWKHLPQNQSRKLIKRRDLLHLPLGWKLRVRAILLLPAILSTARHWSPSGTFAHPSNK